MAWWWKCVAYTHTNTRTLCHTRVCVNVVPNENHINKKHLPEIPKQTQLIFSRQNFFFGLLYFFFASHNFMGHVLCKSSSCLTLIWFCQMMLLLFSLFTVRERFRKIGFSIHVLCECTRNGNKLIISLEVNVEKSKVWLTCFPLFKGRKLSTENVNGILHETQIKKEEKKRHLPLVK